MKSFWLLNYNAGGEMLVQCAGIAIAAAVLLAYYEHMFNVAKAGQHSKEGRYFKSVFTAFVIGTLFYLTAGYVSDDESGSEPIYKSGTGHYEEVDAHENNRHAWRAFLIVAGVGILGTNKGDKRKP